MALPICCACKNFAHLFHEYKCDLDFDLKPQIFFHKWKKYILTLNRDIYVHVLSISSDQSLSNCQILVVLISSKNCLDLKKKKSWKLAVYIQSLKLNIIFNLLFWTLHVRMANLLQCICGRTHPLMAWEATWGPVFLCLHPVWSGRSLCGSRNTYSPAASKQTNNT